MPPQQPLSVELVGINTSRSTDFSRSNYTFEYYYPDRQLLINVAVQKKKGISTIVDFNVKKLAGSLANDNRFTLAGKQPLQYFMLACALLVPLFCIYALVLCVLTPIRKKKWLWIIFIMLGICKFSVNWTTGQWSFSPLSILLFGASVMRPLNGMWVLSISLPLGAICFLTMRTMAMRAGR